MKAIQIISPNRLKSAIRLQTELPTDREANFTFATTTNKSADQEAGAWMANQLHLNGAAAAGKQGI
jgi:hypothetical protein